MTCYSPQPASYHFWKWADNQEPGRPLEVQAQLLRGQLPFALQPFDAHPLLDRLQNAAARWRLQGEVWTWQVHPRHTPAAAHFVHVMCPAVNDSPARVEWFGNTFLPLELSGIEEAFGRIIPCLRPKHSQFIPLQLPAETVYDIDEGDLPRLLRLVVPSLPSAGAELLTRNHGVAALASGRRFRVEWREHASWSAPLQFTQWRAGAKITPHFAIPAHPPIKAARQTRRELLSFAETLQILVACLRGQPRPLEYSWQALSKF